MNELDQVEQNFKTNIEIQKRIVDELKKDLKEKRKVFTKENKKLKIVEKAYANFMGMPSVKRKKEKK